MQRMIGTLCIILLLAACEIDYNLTDELKNGDANGASQSDSSGDWICINANIDFGNEAGISSFYIYNNVPYIAFMDENNLPTVLSHYSGLWLPLGETGITNSQDTTLDETTSDNFFLHLKEGTYPTLPKSYLAYTVNPVTYVMVTFNWNEDVSIDRNAFSTAFTLYENSYYLAYCYDDGTGDRTVVEGNNFTASDIGENNSRLCTVSVADGVPYIAVYSNNNGTHTIILKEFDSGTTTWSIVDDGNATYSFTDTTTEDIVTNLNLQVVANDTSDDDIYLLFEYLPDNTGYMMQYDHTNDAFTSLGGQTFSPVRFNNEKAFYIDNTALYLAYTDISQSSDKNVGKPSLMKFENAAWTSVGENVRINNDQAYNISVFCDDNGVPYVAYHNSSYNGRIKIMKFE